MKMKKILITGASRGIGKAIKERLAGEYELVLHASSPDSFKYDIGKHALLCADFSQPEQVQHFCKQLKKEHGDLYGVINNAGLTIDNSLLFLPERDIETMLQVNLKAPILIAKQAAKIFHSQQRGVIINMSSIIGQTGNAYQSIYAATKAGLVAFSKSLAQELGRLNEQHQIRVNCISPGLIDSEMSAKIPQIELDKVMSNIPSNRIGKTQEVADLVAFLVSEQASYINGANIHINGGLY
ncbi:MAG: SDR family oxidoreductase [Pedobacter sp.]|nr:MAG: SDR family oxidoreductase [Pedobacter sp.]